MAVKTIEHIVRIFTVEGKKEAKLTVICKDTHIASIECLGKNNVTLLNDRRDVIEFAINNKPEFDELIQIVGEYIKGSVKEA